MYFRQSDWKKLVRGAIIAFLKSSRQRRGSWRYHDVKIMKKMAERDRRHVIAVLQNLKQVIYKRINLKIIVVN